MSHFPDPIKLPGSVTAARVKRKKQITGSAYLGICIRACIILFELYGVYLFSSYSLLLDALASIVDIASTTILIICIKLAAQPPDEEHPFGHGRYEPLVGFQLGFMLSLIGAGLLFQQAFQLVNIPSDKTIDPRTWIFPLVALILLELCYQIVIRTAKRQHSPALAADAIHYRMDGLTSLFATIALGIAALYPQWSITIDHLGAVTISILMIFVGFFAARNNFHQIMDRAPEKSFFDKVRKASKNVEGVEGTEKIRIQLYGPDAHVDIDIEVDPVMQVKKAHDIAQKVRAEIQKEWPAVRDVTVHVEPYYPGDH